MNETQEHQELISAQVGRLLGQMPLALYIFDVLERRTVYSNGHFLTELGYGASQIAELGEDILEKLLHPEDAALLPLLLTRWDTVRDNEVIETEYRMLHASGEWRWFLGRDLVFERTADGHVKSILGTAHDITARKAIREALVRSEERLRESEERYRAVFDKAPVGIFVIASDGPQAGTILEANEAAARMHGRSRDYFRGRHVATLDTPEDAAMVPERLRRIAQGETLSFVVRHPHADGRDIPLEVSACKIAYGGQAVNLSFFHDVTERLESEERERRRESERRELEAQMQRAQKLEGLGLLAGGIAHDFNNLLMTILGYADLALHELTRDSRARQFVEHAVQGARQAAELTSQLLAYSGGGSFLLAPVDLSQLAGDMARLLAVSIPKSCTLKFDLLPELPQISADASQIRQVVMNLVINAAEAIGEKPGVIVLRTGIMEDGMLKEERDVMDGHLAPGRYVYLQVSDTGCGMSPEIRAKIFDPFFTTKFTGRGLGLSAVLGIMHSHSGAVYCDSTPGIGTTFKMVFPALVETEGTVLPAANTTPPGISGGTVLVVDDEPAIRELASEMLEKMGFEVIAAADGATGVRLFTENAGRIRLVLLDATMPGMDGAAVCREILKMRPSAKVLLMSGFNESDARRRFGQDRLAGFVQKPATYEILKGAVYAALGNGAKGNGIP